MDSPGPRIPWEVIERAIDHCHGRWRTLQNLALTCHQLLPRTRFVMFTHIRFKNRDDVFAFVDFLQENPHLMPAVRSITVWPPDLAPVPLLSILSRLSEIRFTNIGQFHESAFPELGLHPSSLLGFQQFGSHIQILHLSYLRFKTGMAFARLLLTFSHITHLVCNGVEICESRQTTLPVIIQWQLSQRIRLRALTMEYFCLVDQGQSTIFGRLLDSIPSIKSLITSLTIRWSTTSQRFADRYWWNWTSLQSLMLRLLGRNSCLGDTELILFLQYFRDCGHLTDITIVWDLTGLKYLRGDLLLNKQSYEALDHLLVRHSHWQSKIICTFTSPLSTNGGPFWLGELGKHLPVLSQRGAVAVRSECKNARAVFTAGHDSWISTLEISMDGKWVASGSDDSTIILWDANNGTIAWQWVAHDYNAIYALAFSPDSQYLISSGDNSTNAVAIWDLGRGACKVATLDGPSDEWVQACAWSPDGQTIATGSGDGIVQLWDARTFQQRAICQLGGKTYHLAFSPDGRWLVWRSIEPGYLILDVASGTLHKSLHLDPLSLPPPRLFSIRLEAAFDPTSTRLAIASEGQPPRITVFDIETGNTLLHWKAKGGMEREYMKTISFSPDGRLVLGVLSETYTCYIWDAFTGAKLLHLGEHKGDILTAIFSPCGKYIASGSRDGSVRLWRTCDGSGAAILSEHKRSVEDIAFSPDGKTLVSADLNGRVFIRRMRDIIPPVGIQDDHPLIVPTDSPSSIIEPDPHPDDRGGLFPDKEAHAEELRPIAEGEKVGEREEKRVDGDPAGPGALELREPLADVSIWRDDEDEESAKTGVDSPTAVAERARSATRCPSSGGNSTTPEVEPVADEGGLSASSAQLSSLTLTAREASTGRGQPPSRDVQAGVNSAGSAQPTTTVIQEDKPRIEENAAASGRPSPIAGVSIRHDEDGDEGAGATCPTANEANPIARSSSEACGAAVEDFPMRAVQESPSAAPEREASTTRVRSPTREAQKNALSAGRAKAILTVEQENAARSDIAMVGDERVESARRPSSGDLTRSSARLPSFAPVDYEAPTGRGQPSHREVQDDADDAEQAKVISTVEQEDAACSNSSMADNEDMESARCSSSGVSTMSSARLSFLIPTAGEASIAGGQPPCCEDQEDVKDVEQGQTTLTIEVQNAKDSAASSIAPPPPMNHAINEPEGRGVVDVRAAHPPVTRGGSRWERESVRKALKAVARNVRCAARRVARDAKECCEKLTMFGAKVVLRRRERRASASMP